MYPAVENPPPRELVVPMGGQIDRGRVKVALGIVVSAISLALAAHSAVSLKRCVTLYQTPLEGGDTCVSSVIEFMVSVGFLAAVALGSLRRIMHHQQHMVMI